MLVGGAISASALPYDRMIALDTRQPVVEFIEFRCEKDRKMKNKYYRRCGALSTSFHKFGHVFTAKPQRTQRRVFLFGGEIPPNKKILVLLKQGY